MTQAVAVRQLELVLEVGWGLVLDGLDPEVGPAVQGHAILWEPGRDVSTAAARARSRQALACSGGLPPFAVSGLVLESLPLLFPLPLPFPLEPLPISRCSCQCSSFLGSFPPPGYGQSPFTCCEEPQMKQRFWSTGMPTWRKWQLTPRMHSPFFHLLQGCARFDKGLESRAATALAAVFCWAGLPVGAFAAAAGFLPDSLICYCRAFWLSVLGSPGLSEFPLRTTRAESSVSANRDTSVRA